VPQLQKEALMRKDSVELGDMTIRGLPSGAVEIWFEKNDKIIHGFSLATIHKMARIGRSAKALNSTVIGLQEAAKR
jgi:hypothetical protein